MTTISGAGAVSPDAPAAGLVALIEHLFFGGQENTCNSPNRIFLLGLDDVTKKMIVLHPACGQWSCPYCAKVLAKQWVIRAMLMVQESPHPEQFDFVTLTLHENLKTHQSTVAVFGDAWRKLYAHLKRAQKKFSYILVPELHKDGRVHLHMITDFQCPESYCIKRKRKLNKQVKRMRHSEMMDKFWKDVPRSCGFGYANDQEHLQGDVVKVAGYMAKYLGKQQKVNQWTKGFKHVRASHGIPDVPAQPSDLDGLNWSVCATLEQLYFRVGQGRQLGYRIVNPASGEIQY